MQINCPYCHSEHVHRIILNSSSSHQDTMNSLGSSATFASIGASLTKHLPPHLPVSPWMGGIAGALIGGLFNSLFNDPSPRPSITMSYFYCESCHQNFQ